VDSEWSDAERLSGSEFIVYWGVWIKSGTASVR